MLHLDLAGIAAALPPAIAPPAPRTRAIAAALETVALDLLPPARGAARQARAGARHAWMTLAGLLGV